MADRHPDHNAAPTDSTPRTPDSSTPDASAPQGHPYDVTTPRVRRTAGPYELTRVLGSGGFGVVYEAKHRETGRHYAVKCLQISDQDAERWRKEALYPAQAAARSLHVLDVHDFFEDKDAWYFVMDLLPHGDLRRLMDKSPALPIREALEIGLGIARGVSAIHSADIVHRDLKPSNVLMARLDERWIPKIADFGLARSAESLSLGDFASANYTAPEQLDLAGHHVVGKEADLFALGMILYELVTGNNASGRTDLREYARWLAAHVSPRHPVPPSGLVQIRRPSERRPELEAWPDVDALVMDLLQENPQQRPPAKVVVTTLERAIGSVSIERAAVAPPDRVGRTPEASTDAPHPVPGVKRRRKVIRPLLVTAGAGLLILLGALASYSWNVSGAVVPSEEVATQLLDDVGRLLGLPGPTAVPQGQPRVSNPVPPSPATPSPPVARAQIRSNRTPSNAQSRTAPAEADGADVDSADLAATPEEPPDQPTRSVAVGSPVSPARTALADVPPPAEPPAVPTAAIKPPEPVARTPVEDAAVTALSGTWVGALRREKDGRPERLVLTLASGKAGKASYGDADECVATLEWANANSQSAQLIERAFQGARCVWGRINIIRVNDSALDIVETSQSGVPAMAGRIMREPLYAAQSREIEGLVERWRSIRSNPQRLPELQTVFPTADLVSYEKYDANVERHDISTTCSKAAFVGNDSGVMVCEWSQTTHFKRKSVQSNGRNVVLFGPPPSPRFTKESLLVSLGRQSSGWIITKLTSLRR